MRKSETVHQRHAAQIYAEMLGQVCHKDLYEPNINGFQEVNSHSMFTHLRRLYFMRDMQRSIYFMPNFRILTYEISLCMARNTKSTWNVRIKFPLRNRNLFV